MRGSLVERARLCSSVVRSAFVRRSVASCVAFVLCWFVWRSCAAAHRVKRPIVDVGASTFGHGNGRFATRGGLSTGQRRTSDGRRTGGLLTDGRRAGFGQTWTSPDVPRWAAADCAAHGLETDWRRVRDNARGCLRTLRVRLTPNLPSESIRFLRHIYHEYAQRTTHGRATDFPYRTSSSPSSPLSPCSNQELR